MPNRRVAEKHARKRNARTLITAALARTRKITIDRYAASDKHRRIASSTRSVRCW